MQVYNLGIDEKSRQNGATIEYQIIDSATNQPVFEQLRGQQGTLGANQDQVTLEKSMPLASFATRKNIRSRFSVNDSIFEAGYCAKVFRFTVE